MLLISAGDRLQHLRQEKRLTLSALGATLGGISAAAVSYKIDGKSNISIDDAKLLEAAYGVRAGWILTGEGEMWVNEVAVVEEPRPKYVKMASLYEEDAIGQRFNKALDGYMNRERITSYREIAEAWGVNENHLNDVRHGRKQVSREMIKCALRYSSISANYLLGGVGPMLLQDAIPIAESSKLDRLFTMVQQQTAQLTAQAEQLKSIEKSLKRA